MSNTDSKKRKKLENLAKVVGLGDIGIFEYISELEDKVDELLPSVKEIIAQVKGKPGDDGKTPKKGVDYFDGEPGNDYILTVSDKKEIAGLVKVPIVEKVIERTEVTKEQPIEIVREVAVFDQDKVKEEIPKLGEPIRDSLELLQGEERLDKSAVKGIEDIEKEVEAIKVRPAGPGGSRGFQLYVDGVKEGLVSMINLIPGSGVSLSYNYSSGRNDITISATGGGGSLAVLSATGTIDDSNTDFTFDSEPTILVVNGMSQRSTGDSITWTWDADTSTATLSQAVGTGGSIYGLG